MLTDWNNVDYAANAVMMTAKDNLLARHAFGRLLVPIISSAEYGEKAVPTIAERYKKSEAWVRQHYEFAKKYPVLSQEEVDKIGSWTQARYLLPKRSRDPKSMGGVEKQTASITGSAERAADEAYDFAVHPPEDSGTRKDAARAFSAVSARYLHAGS